VFHLRTAGGRPARPHCRNSIAGRIADQREIRVGLPAISRTLVPAKPFCAKSASAAFRIRLREGFGHFKKGGEMRWPWFDSPVVPFILWAQ
jgi:hypothetical protein